MASQIKLRRGTAAQWTSANPVLAQGEVGFETDTNKLKIGNGSSTWSALNYFSPTPDLSAYLTQASASTTYLTQESASTIYATITDLENIDLSSASAAAVSYLVDSAPGTLDTLNELAVALNDDENFAATVTNSLSNKLGISDASATYLTQASASTTYATKTDLENIDMSDYLSISSASNTYVTIDNPIFNTTEEVFDSTVNISNGTNSIQISTDSSRFISASGFAVGNLLFFNTSSTLFTTGDQFYLVGTTTQGDLENDIDNIVFTVQDVSYSGFLGETITVSVSTDISYLSLLNYWGNTRDVEEGDATDSGVSIYHIESRQITQNELAFLNNASANIQEQLVSLKNSIKPETYGTKLIGDIVGTGKESSTLFTEYDTKRSFIINGGSYFNSDTSFCNLSALTYRGQSMYASSTEHNGSSTPLTTSSTILLRANGAYDIELDVKVFSNPDPKNSITVGAKSWKWKGLIWVYSDYSTGDPSSSLVGSSTTVQFETTANQGHDMTEYSFSVTLGTIQGTGLTTRQPLNIQVIHGGNAPSVNSAIWAISSKVSSSRP